MNSVFSTILLSLFFLLISGSISAAVVITPTPGSNTHILNEAGDSTMVIVTLDAAPTADVTLTFTNNDPTEASVTPDTLVITPANWSDYRFVTLTGVDDLEDDGVVNFTISISSSSADPAYDGILFNDIKALTNDDDCVCVILTGAALLDGLITSEDGESDSFTVTLSVDPVVPVAITLRTGDETEGTVFPTLLNFDSSNFTVPQTVTVTGVDDGAHDGNQVYYIYTNAADSPGGIYHNRNIGNLSAINIDDDASFTPQPIEGSALNGQFGKSVSSAGDVNGDGWGDIIIGAPSEANGENKEGRAHVYYGSATGIAATPDWTAEGNSSNASFGAAVASAGDVNNDGYDDVLVGAYRFSGTAAKAGKVFLYYGSASGLMTTPAWAVEGEAEGAHFGRTVASAGDVNNDGYADIIVGAPGYDIDVFSPDAGRAYLFLGSASGPSLSADWRGGGDFGYSGYGNAVSSAGDINGDGYDDFLVAASKDDQTGRNAGRVYLYHGSNTGIASVTPSWEGYASNSDYFGSSVSGVGDVNGDGYDDILIGSHLATAFNFGPLWNSGKLYVYHGSASGLPPFDFNVPNYGADWVFPENTSDEYSQAYAKLGLSVSGTGDINNDGYPDIIAGATHFDHGETDEGWALIFYGSSSGLSEYPNSLEVNQAEALFGASVSSAGDVDKDGVADFIVGANLYDSSVGANTGAAFLYLSAIPGIIVTPTDGLLTDETSTSATFTVALATPPTADVSIPVASSDPSEGSVSTALLVFTPSNWHQEQIVTISGVDDAETDGDVSYTIELAPATSSDTIYHNRDAEDVSVTNIDDDLADISLSIIDDDAWETGPDTAAVIVSRNGSTASALTIYYSLAGSASNGSDYLTLPGSITIPPGSLSAQITVTPIDDAVPESRESVIVVLSSHASYAIGASGSGTLFIDDSDAPSVRVTPRSGLITTEAGGTASFNVVLITAPSADVTLGLSSSDTSEGKLFISELVFTPSNWNTPQTVVIVGQGDANLDNDTNYSIITTAASSLDADYNAMAVDNVSVTNIDDESLQNITVVSAEIDVREPRFSTRYNGVFTVSRTGSTSSALTVYYSLSGTATPGTDYAPLSGSVTIDAGSNNASIDIVPYPDVMNEGNESVTLTLSPNAAYLIDQPSADTLTIADDDQPSFPIVNFSVDQTVGESNSFDVWVILDRPATEWIFVPYTVSGTATYGSDHLVSDGTISIPTGLDRNKATFSVVGDAISDDGETIIYTMGTMSNAIVGEQSPHTVTIREINLSPVVTLRARQPTDSTRTIVTSLTNPTIEALVTDPNISDTFTYNWSLTDNALVDISGTTTDATFVFLASSVSPGFYNMHVEVTDSGTPPLSVEAELLLEVVAAVPGLSTADSDGDGMADDVESYADSDQDGIADYLDNSALQENQLQQIATQSSSYIMTADPGLQLRLGDVAFAANADGAQVSQADIANYGDNLGGAGLNPEDDLPNFGGYFDFEIAGLTQPGNSARVVIPLLTAIPNGAVYRKYDPLSGWHNFVIDSNNAIASAPGSPGLCPIPSDLSYTAGLNPGHRCLRLTIEDGGPNDNDGIANSVVEDPGKISVIAEVADLDSNDVIVNQAGGGVLNLWVLLFLLSVFARLKTLAANRGALQ